VSENIVEVSLVLHGHFYQPPRENPWTGLIEREPSAYPFNDWNERIYQECYQANAAAPIFNETGEVEAIINNYANLSFNFGPSLLNWLERHHPQTYSSIIEADRESYRRRGGHGNAIAQGYNHSILPLCNERDRRTQVRWGMMDFRHRFGRDPESLWLPETAANDETLCTLIEEGLKYVILSPYQAERIRRDRQEEWKSVADGSIDTTQTYRYCHRDGSGRSIAVFFYNGQIAKAIAFDGILRSSKDLVDRFESSVQGSGGIINVATDGESYGHHFRHGEMCLAYALEVEAARRGFRVTNYGECLERQPPEIEVEIKPGFNGEGTAWSCAHGLGRWTRDCSCHAGAPSGWNQAWRAPLRRAFDYLRDEAARHFEAAGGDLFRDPWEARDAYIELLVAPWHRAEDFLRRFSPQRLSAEDQRRAIALLELQRYAMLMYTSCGWFFNDISGLETVQNLKYAGRLLDLMRDLGLPLPDAEFIELLAQAKSNVPKHGTGADIYRHYVELGRAGIEPSLRLNHLDDLYA
jgi:alpha-amylase/alpha-mannosidase (GH57 family)